MLTLYILWWSNVQPTPLADQLEPTVNGWTEEVAFCDISRLHTWRSSPLLRGKPYLQKCGFLWIQERAKFCLCVGGGGQWSSRVVKSVHRIIDSPLPPLNQSCWTLWRECYTYKMDGCSWLSTKWNLLCVPIHPGCTARSTDLTSLAKSPATLERLCQKQLQHVTQFHLSAYSKIMRDSFKLTGFLFGYSISRWHLPTVAHLAVAQDSILSFNSGREMGGVKGPPYLW